MKRLLVPGSILALFAVSQARADIPVVTFTSSSTLVDSRPFTLGFKFMTSVPFTVADLGVWDDGLGNNHQVGIWDSTGTLLASTTVLSTDPVTAFFQYHPITPFVLSPGTYTVGAEFFGTSGADPFPWLAAGISSLPGYSWVADEQVFGSGLNFPTLSVGGYGSNGIFYADFEVSSAPEPASILLCLTVALLVGVGMRRKVVSARQWIS